MSLLNADPQHSKFILYIATVSRSNRLCLLFRSSLSCCLKRHSEDVEHVRDHTYEDLPPLQSDPYTQCGVLFCQNNGRLCIKKWVGSEKSAKLKMFTSQHHVRL